MTLQHVESEIGTRKSSTHSTDDQIAIAHAMWDEGITPDHDGLRAAEIEERLDLDLEFNLDTSLRHLRDIDLVDTRFKSNNEWHPVATWLGDDGEILFGDELDDAIHDATEAIIDQMPDVPDAGAPSVVADGLGPTVRHVVADEFDYDPGEIHEYLREHDDDAETLNKAVSAIEESDDVESRDDYGKVEFVPRAFYYRLSHRAVGMYQQ